MNSSIGLLLSWLSLLVAIGAGVYTVLSVLMLSITKYDITNLTDLYFRLLILEWLEAFWLKPSVLQVFLNNYASHIVVRLMELTCGEEGKSVVYKKIRNYAPKFSKRMDTREELPDEWPRLSR